MKTIFSLSKWLYNKRIVYPFCIVAFLLLSFDVDAQESKETKKWMHSIQLDEGYRISEGGEWSRPGVNYTAWYRISPSFGIVSRTGFLIFEEADLRVFYTTIGVHVRALSLSKGDLLLVGTAGTSATVGNDFGAFFGMLGAGLQYLPFKSKSVNFALGWYQNTAFHPDHWSYINASIGYSF